jgi:DNA replication protein DnaC
LLSLQVRVNTASYELTEEEKEMVLRQAQEEKERRIRYEEDKLIRAKWEAHMRRPWTGAEMAEFVIWKAQERGIDFVIDDNNCDAFKAMCLYATGNEKFSTAGEGFSLKKGILICGPIGTGKSTLMRLFRSNQHQSYSFISCRSIADLFKMEGEAIIHRFSKPLVVPADASTFYKGTIGTCFDDLGTEGVKKHFGDASNVMAEIISNRYDNNIPHNMIHLTTNLTADEIQEYYGERVRSRMREMFNTIMLTGGDRRR